jgi:hypothetical protein
LRDSRSATEGGAHRSEGAQTAVCGASIFFVVNK